MKKSKILESFVSLGSFNEFIDNILLLSERESSSYICVCNVHMLIEAKKSRIFNNILNKAAITTPDGGPVAKAISWKYKITQERVSGMDLLPSLFSECNRSNKSVFLYGSTNKVLVSMVEKVNKKYPNINIEYYSPPFRELSKYEKDNIISIINNKSPDFVFVSLGCPKQEKWMAQNKGLIKSCMIGLGGAFEVYSGLKRRAPKWMYENSLEWLYRLLLEPKRLLKRYLVTNSLFIWYLCKEFLEINKE